MTNQSQTTKVVTGEVRFSYVHLLEPDSFEGQDPKYSTVLLIPKSDKKTITAIRNAQKVAAEAGKSTKFGGTLPKHIKTTLRDGDTDEAIDTDENPEYKNHYFISVSSKTKPGIVDKNVQEIIDPGEIYSGMYGRASINFFAYNTAGNKGVSAGLNNVQKTRDGDFLGGRSKAEDDFSEWDNDDEDGAADDDLLD